MILILKKLNKLLLVALLVLGLSGSAKAQDALTLSVSPTLFEMTANPGQDWKSTVRVVNANAYEIKVYVDVINFEAQGETGQVKFLPLLDKETEGQTLAEWIHPEMKEVTIPAEQTMEIPFAISVPPNADPGGHFAALLIGTKSLDNGGKQTLVETSQVVTSLVFLRVTGDINEKGVIREFRSTQSVVEKPKMSFELRFENSGNVQVLPQGDIRIFNMWGQERGVIPVNRQTMFGNVLPKQIRKYSFNWEGEWSLADMGRYKAVATLAYGLESRQFANSETTFWVIPWKILLLILLLLVGFITTMTWAIKMYIRKMLTMAGLSSDTAIIAQAKKDTRSTRKVSVVAPIEEGILDLRYRFNNSITWKEKLSSVVTFVKQYKIFFAIAITVLIFIIAVIMYIKSASVEKRGYEVTVESAGEDIKISSEQVEYDEKKNLDSVEPAPVDQRATPPLILVNQSGVNGLAAELRIQLESKGYTISDLSNDFTIKREKTVIVYAPKFAEEALEISRQIEGALLSAYDDAQEEMPITIYVGKDFESTVQ